jgi:hypothetical protein
MNKKFIGSDARDVVKRWEQKDPSLRAEIEKAKQRRKQKAVR